jgi:hypothetical protein
VTFLIGCKCKQGPASPKSSPKSFFFFSFSSFFLDQKRLFFLFLFCFFFSFFSRPKTFFITVKLDRSLKKARSTVPPLASHFIHRPQMPPRGSPRKGTRSLEMINNTYIVLINSTLRLTGSLSFSFLSVLHPHIQPHLKLFSPLLNFNRCTTCVEHCRR